jgi:hypothetical protein
MCRRGPDNIARRTHYLAAEALAEFDTSELATELTAASTHDVKVVGSFSRPCCGEDETPRVQARKTPPKDRPSRRSFAPSERRA